jgi:formylglycine-generating enzyme required for sulfatase activity
MSIRALTILSACVAMIASDVRAQCTGDIVQDARVDGIDLGVLLGYWGPRNSAPLSLASDLNLDGYIDANDLGMLLAGWGPCPIPPFTVPTWATLIEGPPDPAVVRNAALRQAIIATGWAWRVRDTRTQIEMVLIPPGSFQMGCSASINSGCDSFAELPIHTVTLTSAFYLGRYEVTQAQWRNEMGYDPSNFNDPIYPESTRPLDRVSWNEIQSFNAQTGLRLPSEAEWEYACRAGTGTAFHGFLGYEGGTNSDALVGQIAWFPGNTLPQGSPGFGPQPVGQKLPNGFGVFDMSGNVWEWVSDWYLLSYYSQSPAVNPQGPSSGSSRVIRGGHWSNYATNSASYVRSSARGSSKPSYGGSTTFSIGFRAARNP